MLLLCIMLVLEAAILLEAVTGCVKKKKPQGSTSKTTSKKPPKLQHQDQGPQPINPGALGHPPSSPKTDRWGYLTITGLDNNEDQTTGTTGRCDAASGSQDALCGASAVSGLKFYRTQRNSTVVIDKNGFKYTKRCHYTNQAKGTETYLCNKKGCPAKIQFTGSAQPERINSRTCQSLWCYRIKLTSFSKEKLDMAKY